MAELKIRVIFDTSQALAAHKEFTGSVNDNVDRMIKKADQLSDHYNKIQFPKRHVDEYTRAVSEASYMMQAFNYTMRDAPYFAKDFALGILAVGNNLNPLIDGVIRTRQEAEKLNKGFFEIVKQSLSGGGGLILGFTLLVSALQAVTFWLDQSKNKTKDTQKSFDDIIVSVKEYEAKLTSLTKTMKEYNEAQGITEKVQAIREKIQEKQEEIKYGKFYTRAGERIKLQPEEIEARKQEIELLRSQIAELQASGELALGIANNIKMLNQAYNKLGTAKTTQDLENFKKEANLTDAQFKNLMNQFQWLSEHWFRASGEKAKGIFTKDTEQLLERLNITKDGVSNIITLYGQIDKKTSTKIPREKPLFDFPSTQEYELQLKYLKSLLMSIDKFQDPVKWQAVTEKIHELTTELKEAMQFVNTAQPISLDDIVIKQFDYSPLRNQKSKTGKYIGGLRSSEGDLQLLKEYEKEYKKIADQNVTELVKDGIDDITRASTELGTALANAFRRGDDVAKQLIQTLEEMALKFLFIQALAYIFSGGTAGFFGGAVSFTDAFFGGKITPKLQNLPSAIPVTPTIDKRVIEVKGVLIGQGTTLKAVVDNENTIKRMYY
ncbi:MAG: hypothetical protein AB1695_12460 [Stygiobacter sp.]